MTRLEEMGAAAKQAARKLAVAGNQKDTALEAIAAALEAHTEEILAANREDLFAAEQNGMSRSLMDRLALNEKRIAGMADGVRQVKAQPDPVDRCWKAACGPMVCALRKSPSLWA